MMCPEFVSKYVFNLFLSLNTFEKYETNRFFKFYFKKIQVCFNIHVKAIRLQYKLRHQQQQLRTFMTIGKIVLIHFANSILLLFD